MSRSEFAISYDGPALADHTMDVRDLAPAMMGLAQLCDAANTVLNGEKSKIKVHAKATGAGSFQITFEIIQSVTQNVLSFLASSDASAAANLKTLLFGGGSIFGVPSLIWLIHRLRGRSPDKITSISADTVRITIGGETYDIPLALIRLYQDIAVRTAVQKVIEEPLKSEGVEDFKIIDGTSVVIKIEKGEAVYFSKPVIADNTLTDDIRRLAFSIISLSFKEDNKWRLNDGANPISANIEDKDFLEKVDNNQVAFSKGDILICDVRVLQKQTEGGLKTEYTVVRVVDHRPAARQIPLPLENPPQDAPEDS